MNISKPNSWFSLIFLVGLLLILTFTESCNKEDAALSPTLSTSSVNDLIQTTATSGGNITSDGGAAITSRGVCWSNDTNPTIVNSKTLDGVGTGNFVSTITGLTPGSAYFIRAYATNSAGTGYGNAISFTTLPPLTAPTVTTSAVNNITQITATSGGNITFDGGAMITSRGVCWSNGTTPTIADNKTLDGTDAGNFISTIAALTPGSTYFIRAYATNSAGTGYGAAVSFTTLPLIPYIDISGSSKNSLALKADGTLWWWGANAGSLYANTNIPLKRNCEKYPTSTTCNSYIAIASGGDNFLTINQDGTAWSWGSNSHGQLGQAISGFVVSTNPTNSPTNYTSLAWIVWGSSTFSRISTGAVHSLAIKTNGTLWAWGWNFHGQLGNGTKIDSNEPVKTNGTGYSAIAAGGNHSLAIKTDGTLWSWGSNIFGELGDGTNVDKNIPVKIGSDFSVIAAGTQHSLALKTDGSLWGWGRNIEGQLGDGTNSDKNMPTLIGTGYSAIAAGTGHSLALKTDGSLWVWGYNIKGQLGDGTSANKNVPVKIGLGYKKIAAGALHSLALKTDETLWVWGDNQFGELGDGTTVNKSTPVKID